MRQRLFARQSGDAPLLTGQEIAELTAAAPPHVSNRPLRRPRAGRPGEQVSPRHGSGSDFAEPRAYQPGDDPRRIDWRASARSRAPLVRSYHAELSRPSCLVIDRRASMRFGTRTRLKVTQAVRAALWLGGREVRAGGELAAVLLDEPCRWLPPSRGPRALRRLTDWAVAPCPPREPGCGEPAWDKVLTSLRRRLPQGSELTIVSDFSGLDTEDLGLLRALGRHSECHAIRIVDRAERDPLPTAALELCWQGERYEFNASDASAAAELRHGQQDWDGFLAGEFRRAGISYRVLAADADSLADLATVPR